jgi:4-amino-4-deoxy-L-arabinose transferase-like glycosyltransferase
MKDKKIIFTILILAAVLRFYNLGSNPPSLYWDEVSLGYNAYSILTTGRDEHGEFLPLTRFIAFGDYKPAGYIYATVPSIAIFGLNEFAIRFPSALAGTLTVLVTYFLVKELFKEKKWTMDNGKWKISLPALSAFLLAVSPWHLQFSRGAFEANLATFFGVTAIYFFLKGIKQGKFLIPSALFFTLSMYTFNTHRIFIPIIILVLAALNRRELIRQPKHAVAGGLLGLVLIAPLVPFLLSREGQLRFQEVTIFRNLDPIVTANERIEREGSSLWARAIHNRRIQFALEFAKHYFDHLRADFLFFSGDVNPRLGTRDQGLLYPIELPLLLIGIYVLVKKKHPAMTLLCLWLFIGILPSATARETPHALRTMNVLPAPQIIAAIGIVGALQLVNTKKLLGSLLITSYSLLIIYYLHTYHIHYPDHWAISWQYGYKQTVNSLALLQDDYDRVYVTNKYGRPYIYLLFYQKYAPQSFWETRDAERDWFGFWTVKGFDKYIFSDPPAKEDENTQRWLLVTGPDGLPQKANPIEKILFPNGDTVFEIGELE